MLTSLSDTLWIALPVIMLLAVVETGEAAEKPLDEARVKAVADMLPEQPTGLGKPIGDREAWDKLGEDEAAAKVIAKAEALLKEPLPEQSDDLYLDFSRTGNRTRWQKVMGQRRGRVPTLVLAECLENKGRFLEAFEQLVEALCAEPTWVYPAHDRSLANFNGKTIDIDLASSALAWSLATADWLLGDKLSAETRELIRDNVRRRALDPFLDMVNGKRGANWWMKTTNNWNSVCLAGVTGAALEQVESREERAQFVAGAEEYSRNFLRGFTPDGYCSEGLGYWNYGFGHYVLLSETIHQATGGQLDLFARPEAEAPATFGARIQIINGVSPAFADCGIHTRPSYSTTYYVNRRFGLGLREYDELPTLATGSLFQAMIFGFPNSVSDTAPADEAAGPELRTYFEQAGVLISRPLPGSNCRMGVALKGGHNAEHHNHNDVGSYVVVIGERPVLLDPGSEVYTARTFSSRRYESKLLNSYGHPVPVVAGKLQSPGGKARAKVLKTDFTDAADTFALDLKAAYDVPDLKALERTFVYSREGAGALTITDRVEFESPQAFSTALITLGQWKQTGPGSLMICDEEGVRVDIESPDCEFATEAEEIDEDGARPTRIGINLTEPVKAATVTVRITPFDDLPGDGGLLRNGGFERLNQGWNLGRDRMGSIAAEQAASGEASLKIVDRSKKSGSNISSTRMPVHGAGQFELRGKVFHVSGSGIGMYVRYLDPERKLLNVLDKRGWLGSVGSLEGKPGTWAPFTFRFEAPDQTAFLQVWIHSYNAAQVEAYLDDLQIVPL